MNDNEIELDYLLRNLSVHDNNEEKMWAASANKRFEKFYEEVREQPLSSFIRAMEIKCRKLQPVFHQSFEIRWRYTEENKGSCFLTNDAGIFVISIPSSFKKNEMQVRNLVAHEIGHLYSTVVSLEKEHLKNGSFRNINVARKFLLDCLNSAGLEREKIETYNKRADMIGVFVLNERSRFYKHRMPLKGKDFCKSFRQIADEFKAKVQ
jgi:hypothetical protein